MNCRYKVPWIDGEPKDICKLDDEKQLCEHNLQLSNSLKKGDYYVQIKTGIGYWLKEKMAIQI